MKFGIGSVLLNLTRYAATNTNRRRRQEKIASASENFLEKHYCSVESMLFINRKGGIFRNTAHELKNHIT